VRDDLHRILRGAVDAVEPSRLVEDALGAGALDSIHHKTVMLVAAGKAAWPMAFAFAEATRAEIRSAVVAGPRIDGRPLPPSFEHFAAGHPTPNEESERAGRRALELARDHSTTLVVLLSGGASAMLSVPADGISLDDKVRTYRSLLKAGIGITDLNCVRKHLSAIKGGQLAAQAAETVTLAISDVHTPIPDNPSVIGSGPTVADPSTFRDALGILHRAYADDAAELPRAVLRRVERGANGEIPDTPKPGDVRLVRSRFNVIGNRGIAMRGAAGVARALGYTVTVIDEPTSGDARAAGQMFATTAVRSLPKRNGPFCVIASGETTVRVRGSGHGGRNLEFALAMAPALSQARLGGQFVVAASAGTDGIDGPTDAAGAIVDWATLDRARAAGLSADDTFARNDAYPFFERLGDLIQWGPTGTNVGDVHVLLSTARSSP
jgi:glycerate 2-kinase